MMALIPLFLISGLEVFLIWQGQLSPEDFSSATTENMVFTLLFNCFLFPVMEEVMFRGILLHKLLPLGTRYSILLTTCLFVIIHYNNPVNMVLSLVMGLVFAYIAIKAKGILPAIILHIGLNLLGQVILPAVIAAISTLT